MIDFIREKRELLLYYLLSSGSLLAVYALAGFGLSNVCYAAFLQTAILLCFLVPGAIRFKRQKRAIKDFEQELFDSEALLPAPHGPIEQAYLALLFSARERYGALKASKEREQNESLTYYTLWVHQIKTPIASMRLMLDEGADVRPLLKQELFKVERYADLALQYVRLRDILSDLVIEPCDLRAAVQACVKKYALLFIYQKLSVSIEPFEQTVMSDIKWVDFIVEQLLSNAVKYTKTGGVTIRFLDGALHIADTGAGIRAEDIPRVFEKGYTGYNGRVDGRASGIGLFLTKRVCDALSVRITLSSEKGKGTDVSLRFPDADVTKM